MHYPTTRRVDYYPTTRRVDYQTTRRVDCATTRRVDVTTFRRVGKAYVRCKALDRGEGIAYIAGALKDISQSAPQRYE